MITLRPLVTIEDGDAGHARLTINPYLLTSHFPPEAWAPLLFMAAAGGLDPYLGVATLWLRRVRRDEAQGIGLELAYAAVDHWKREGIWPADGPQRAALILLAEAFTDKEPFALDGNEDPVHFPHTAEVRIEKW